MQELSRLKVSDVLFWVIAGAAAAMLVVLVLIVGGAIPIGSPGEPDAAPEQLPATVQRRTTAPTTEAANTSPATTATTAPAQTVVVLKAVRGNSWFSARVGSESGRVLDERVLAQGESVRLRARRVWLSIGAAGNVEVTVDGKPKELSPGTVSLVLSRARV